MIAPAATTAAMGTGRSASVSMRGSRKSSPARMARSQCLSRSACSGPPRGSVARRRRTAGSASALLGVLQYVIGAAAAPLVGIAGESTAVPMAIVIATLGVLALSTFTILTRQEQS